MSWSWRANKDALLVGAEGGSRSKNGGHQPKEFDGISLLIHFAGDELQSTRDREDDTRIPQRRNEKGATKGENTTSQRVMLLIVNVEDLTSMTMTAGSSRQVCINDT